MGDLARAHALLQVTFLAAMLCVVVVVTAVALVVVVTTTTRVFGSGGGCRSPLSIIGIPAIWQGHLATGTRAFARREVWVPVRSSQSPGTSKCQLGNGQLAAYEFGMNVLVCVYDLRFIFIAISITQLNVIQYNNWHWN